MPTVLCVAEKPSLAASIAGFLSDGTHKTRRGGQDVHEFVRVYDGQRCDFKVTAVCGHVLSIDFPDKYQDWDVDPGALFDAPVVKKEASPGARVVSHLEQEAKGATHLVLWLDCDREGENICYEVVDACVPRMRPPPGAARDDYVKRAKFSAVSKESIERAMATLGTPNRHEAMAVDARQELDLKLGVAFTRFQTRYFRGKYAALDASVVSYGPCQTPTLNFAVERHLDIAKHVPEDYWVLCVTARSTETDEVVALRWNRERVFDRDAAELFKRLVVDDARANGVALTAFTRTEEKRPRPSGLNTVEMLKAASAGLGMGAHAAMQVAERLYISGFISYPRTESTAYPPGFDLRGTLSAQRHHPAWGEHVAELLDGGAMTRPRGGKDEGDHPPIAPTRSATSERVGGGDAWRLYDFIARHFIASLSPDCAYDVQRASFACGGEGFAVVGQSVIEPGWTKMMPWRAIEEDPLPELTPGAKLAIAGVELTTSQTSPPPYLSESDLISLMEKNGIGTDASIPAHINNVEKRGYVKIGAGRRVVPTDLGVTLTRGYHAIDPDLALPSMRASVEKQLDLIASGEATHAAVVAHALKQFAAKFHNFVANVDRMDSLFEAHFSPSASTERPFSKCGSCCRYLKLVTTTPQRLYCATQEAVYDLPPGVVKLYHGRECVLCGFELLLLTSGDRTYPLCPYCFNHPPTGMGHGARAPRRLVSGCPHPSAHPIVAELSTGPCPECDPDDDAVLLVEPVGGARHKLVCSECTLLVKFSEELTHKVCATEYECGGCGGPCVEVTYKREKTPLAGGETRHVACVACDDLLRSQITLSRGRGGGGRGRGRGRRGE